MVTDSTLQQGWLSAINAALADPVQAEQILDNFLNSHGFPGLTYDQVTAAEEQVLAYDLSYWQGTYDTTNTTTSQSGPQLVISLDANKNVQVNYNGAYIIGFTFQNLVLQWNPDSGLNTTTGQLIFSSASDGNGNLINGFTGNIGDTRVAGALQPPVAGSGGGMGGYIGFMMMIAQVGAQLGQMISQHRSAPPPGAQQLAQRAGQALNEPGPDPAPQGGNAGNAELPEGLRNEQPVDQNVIQGDNPNNIANVREQNGPPGEEGGDGDGEGEPRGQAPVEEPDPLGDIEPFFSDVPIVV
jgi:hypothetical protein